MAIGLQIGLDIGGLGNSTGSAFIARTFKNRVIADGGTFEAMPCLIATIIKLEQINIPSADNIARQFKLRVYSDGGLFEAESCLVQTINNLQ